MLVITLLTYQQRAAKICNIKKSIRESTNQNFWKIYFEQFEVIPQSSEYEKHEREIIACLVGSLQILSL